VEAGAAGREGHVYTVDAGAAGGDDTRMPWMRVRLHGMG
jgi:hypothetical protein